MPVPDTISLKSRNELVDEARRLGIERPERMTRVELRDEIVRRTVPESQQSEVRGLFGVARSMLASVVESGLNMPDAARLIRGQNTFEVPVASQTPVATVTLAEIYAAQGHKERALQVLEDVLAQEPGHVEALRVKAQLLHDAGADAGPRKAKSDNFRELATVEAPPVVELPGETTEYIPGGFVETTGEEIETGRPPEVTEPVQAETVQATTLQATAPLAAATESPTSSEAEAEEMAPNLAQSLSPVLVLEQNKVGLVIYWELPDDTLGQCSIDPDDGQAVVRVVGFSPEGASPQRREETVVLQHTVAVAAPPGCTAGKFRLSHFGEPCAVRAALGWESDAGFLPFTVGREFAAWAADPHSQTVVTRATKHLTEAQ